MNTPIHTPDRRNCIVPNPNITPAATVGERRGGGKKKRLTGAGISSILTAVCAEVRGEKQKRSANLCGFKHYINYIFQQP